MNLYELRALIVETTSAHWNVISTGPLYNYNLGTINDVASVFGCHSVRAVLEEDLDVALEFGMSDDPFDHKTDWQESWAEFPDRRIYGEYCDVFYRGALVDRVHLASVDGGRAVLPLPERSADGWAVKEWPYQVARLADELTGHHEFDDYFARSGITRLPA